MGPCKLNGDCLFHLSRFVVDLKDIVRLWIALGKPVAATHKMWRKVLRDFLLKACKGQVLEDVIMRLGCRLDSYGLLLLERMHVYRKCNRSGCYTTYREIDNLSTQCCYHKGVMRKGRLSCCQQTSFREKGCTYAWHDGSLHEHLFLAREQLMPPQPLHESDADGAKSDASDVDSHEYAGPHLGAPKARKLAAGIACAGVADEKRSNSAGSKMERNIGKESK
jgi:hypothetical protein